MAAKKKGRPRKKPEVPVSPPKKLIPKGATWKFLTLEEWKANPTCVNFVRELHANSMYQMFLGMLHNWATNRSNMPLNETACAIELGRIEGHRDLLGVMVDAAVPSVQPDEDMKAYGYPDAEEDEPLNESSKII